MPSPAQRSGAVEVGPPAPGEAVSGGRGATRRRGALLLLALIVAVAFLVRAWGIEFGLPNKRARPDEAFLVGLAIRALRGDLNPHSFLYPSLFMYFMSGVYLAWYGLGRFTGTFSSGREFIALWYSAPGGFLLAARWVSVVLGTANVVLVYRIGGLLFDRRVGLLAAFFLALSFLHVSQSHFGVTDVPLTFMISWAFLLIVRARAEPSAGRFVWAGIVSGLAAGTKYNALLLAGPLVIVAVERALARRDGAVVRRALGPIGLFSVAFGVAFLASTPYALLDFPKFWTDLKLQAHILRNGHMFPVDHAWWVHLRVTLWYGLGPPLFCASLLGFVVLARRDARKALFFAAFPAAYYFVAGSGKTVIVRYVDPLLPFLALGAALATVWLAARLARAVPAAPEGALSAALALVLVLPSARSVIAWDRLLAQTDTRVLAAEWIQAYAEPGDMILITETIHGRPDLEPERFGGCLLAPGTNEILCRGEPGILPEWIVVQEYPLETWSPGAPENVRALLETRYEIAAEFIGIQPGGWHVFDRQDAFYLPYAGFEGVERPGPNLSIYARR